MIDFIDKTSEKSGTPINRNNLMAIQGFEAKTMSIINGDIVIINNKNEKLTIHLNDDGSYSQKFEGEKTLTLTTNITIEGIKEILS